MPRTTLDIDAGVLAQLRNRAAQENKSMGQVASEALVRALNEPDRTAPERPRWIARELGVPRVDLEDDEALRRALDEPGQ